MDARSPLSSTFVRALLRWLLRGGLALAAGLIVWVSGLGTGLWRLPSTWSTRPGERPPSEHVLPLQEAPLASQPTTGDLLSPGGSPPQADLASGKTLYLPVISVGPATNTVVGPVMLPPVAGSPTARPLLLPDPRLEIPLSQAKQRGSLELAAARATLQPSSQETPAAVAAASPAETGSVDAASAVESGVGGPTAEPTTVLAGAPPGPEVLAVESGRWTWPVQGEISQSFSTDHPAIDVSAEHGTLVVAADGGQVIYAEWEISGYGYLVIVEHGDEVRSYYAHLYGFYVEVGQWVERGDLLGQLGNTGDSTGPHLHFEIRYQGIQYDPLELLPPGQGGGRNDPLTGQR